MPVRAELPSGSEQGLQSDVLPFSCLQGWGALHTSLASVPTLDLLHGKGPSSAVTPCVPCTPEEGLHSPAGSGPAPPWAGTSSAAPEWERCSPPGLGR